MEATSSARTEDEMENGGLGVGGVGQRSWGAEPRASSQGGLADPLVGFVNFGCVTFDNLRSSSTTAPPSATTDFLSPLNLPNPQSAALHSLPVPPRRHKALRNGLVLVLCACKNRASSPEPIAARRLLGRPRCILQLSRRQWNSGCDQGKGEGEQSVQAGGAGI